jgi:hypothetical protein
VLRPYLALLRKHFAGAPGPFIVEEAELAAGRTAALVASKDESDPIVLVLDRDALLFAKERPVAGITPPVTHVTIAPGPERGVAIFAYVESMQIVAARFWADDSNAFADVEVFHPRRCAAVSVASEGSAGWIAACSSRNGTYAQRLRADLTIAWPKEGVLVGAPGPVGRATMAFEGPTTWTLTQVALGVGGDRKLSSRYTVDGEALP